MTTMSKTQAHPAQFSAELIPALTFAIDKAERRKVFDPFAGPGVRLGKLCDDMGVEFAGIDIENWPGRDLRVRLGDATNSNYYPTGMWHIVTSPTYGNGLNDHHEPKEDSRRFTYRVALDRDLHPNNSGRYGIRGGRKSWNEYWRIHGEAIAVWAELGWPVTVNVKAFVHDGEVVDLPAMWEAALASHGFFVRKPVYVETPGIRYGSNSEKRAKCETILQAVKPYEG